MVSIVFTPALFGLILEVRGGGSRHFVHSATADRRMLTISRKAEADIELSFR